MMTASDIMSTDVVTVTPDTALSDLAKKFVETRFSNLPVLDEAGKLIGVISETDLIEQQRPLHIPTVMTLFDWVFAFGNEKRFQEEVDRVTAAVVGELYQKDPVVCTPDTSVRDIAGLMSQHKVHLLPVVDGGAMVGVVARLDVIRVMEN